MKKFLLFLVLFFSFVTPVFGASTLYQKETSSVISSGVTHKNYIRFTSNGWQNINVLKVDLEDKHNNLGLLTSSNGVGTLQNLKTMATNSDSIAAINADFFQAKSGKGNSVGVAIEDGEMISSSYYGNLDKDEFATFVLDENNSIFYDFFTNEITLKSMKTKNSTSVSEINKFPRSFENIVIYTPAWGTHSHGSQEDLPLTEMVVENNKVVDIRYNQEAVEIPEDGFVVSAIGKGSEFIKENFKVGTKVKLNIETNFDLDEIALAVSGGAILLEKGRIPETFSSNISGNHPRTAIGSSKDESTLFLVTVDGRQESSLGMTQQELAEFLKELDVYNAINLDGGGSTTMVARKLGDFNLSTINSPSGTTLRSVINGIGIFNSAPSSDKISKLIIEVEDTNVFKGKERKLEVKGYNKYYNPIEIDMSDVVWSYDGVPVTIENGILTGETVGMTMLQAKVGKASAKIEINILSDPSELSISPKKSTISSGKNINLMVSAKNKNGYYSSLTSEETTWKIEQYIYNEISTDIIPEESKLENGIFTAKQAGDYIISVSDGNIKSYALITVSEKNAKIIYDFEDDTKYSFDPYPDEVSGSALATTEQSHSGKYSSKLSYDFKQDIAIRAAYIEFKDDGIVIPNDTTDISFWLYNDSPKDDHIKIKLQDSNGKYQLIVLQKGITHEGWKEFSYSLESFALPGKITDIYIAQDNLEVQSEGYVYIDDLTFYTQTNSDTTSTKLPKDIKGVDSLNKPSELENEDSFRIALIDKIPEKKLMIEHLKNKKIEEFINSNSDIAIFTDSSDTSNIEKDKIILDGYTKCDYKNSTFITIDCIKNSIRTTDCTQWINIQTDLKNAETENIFVIMNNSLDNFSDNEEARLFIDMLCELKRELNKNIWVLHKGNYTDYSMERGIKYLGINTEQNNVNDISKNTNCILITVNGKELTYEIKNVFK